MKQMQQVNKADFSFDTGSKSVFIKTPLRSRLLSVGKIHGADEWAVIEESASPFRAMRAVHYRGPDPDYAHDILRECLVIKCLLGPWRVTGGSGEIVAGLFKPVS